MGDPSQDFTYRCMEKADIPEVLDIWYETGMHEGTHCLYTWLEVDPEGFRIAVTKEGTIVGVCAGVIHHGDLAFVGIYAVRKQYRGCGVGMKLWQQCVEHFGSRNGAVNAVPGKMELYRDKGGFPLEEPSWVNVVNECTSDVNPTVLLKEIPDVEIRPIGDIELPLVIKYDSTLMGYNREKIIALTVREEKSEAYVAFKDDTCVGYGVLKTSIQGQSLVGPLYADNQDIAEILLRRLIETLTDVKGFAMMTVSTNENAKAILSKLSVPSIEECPRLYTKQKLIVDKSKVYGQLDLNFSPF